VVLELGEKGAEVLVVFLRVTAKDKDIVYVGETKIQAFEDIVHETLESLSSILEAEGHTRKFEQAKRSGNGCFLDVFGVNGNLVVSSYQVNFGKHSATGKAVGIILDMWNWIPVGDGASVKGSVISAGSPPAVLLGHEMEGG
jgi:hypothetical protein